MTLPDARRLLQAVLARVVFGCPLAHAIEVSAWRQRRNRVARESHARTRRLSEMTLRNTG